MEMEYVFRESAEYDFTTDWFTRHTPMWKIVLETLKPSKILEIGCFEGRATTYMIEQCGERNPVNIFTVDSFRGGVEHDGIDFDAVQARFDANCEHATKKVKHPAKVFKLIGDSLQCLGKLAAENIRNFDLTYVDGSHMASDVFFDAAMAFQLTRVGGAIIFDDFNQPDDTKPYDYPKIAIEAFHQVHANKLKPMQFYTDQEYIKEEELYQRYYWKIAA